MQACRTRCRGPIVYVSTSLFVLVCLTATVAITPHVGLSVIREQQPHQQQQHRQYSGTAQPTENRRTQLRTATDSMSCPSTSEGTDQSKTAWPELQGKTAEEAEAVLQQEAPGYRIQVIPADHMATADYRCDRIRIWLNSKGRVSQIPKIG